MKCLIDADILRYEIGFSGEQREKVEVRDDESETGFRTEIVQHPVE